MYSCEVPVTLACLHPRKYVNVDLQWWRIEQYYIVKHKNTITLAIKKGTQKGTPILSWSAGIVFPGLQVL